MTLKKDSLTPYPSALKASAQFTRKVSWQDEVMEEKREMSQRTGSSLGAYFNIVCVIAGTGTLQLPYALNQAGWFGLVLILLSAVIAIYTGNLLIKCLYAKEGKRLHGYADIGEAAFGTFGRIFVQIFHYTILLGAACIYIMLSGINLDKLLTNVVHLGVKPWIVISAAIIWIPFVSLKSLKEVAILSVFGALATVVVVVVTIILAGVQLAAPSFTSPHHDWINPAQLPIALASISFSFGGNVVYPHVEQSMRHPKSWHRVLTAAIVTICLMYLAISIPAYLAYGEKTESPVLNSLPEGMATTAAFILITAHVILAAPILMTSFSLEMEQSFGVDALPAKTAFFYRFSIRSLITSGLTVLAMTIPFFGDFMSLIGALANCMIVFVLPVVCYLKLFKHSAKKWEWFFGLIIVVIGLLGCVLGVMDAMKALIRDFQQDPNNPSSVTKLNH